MINIKIGMQFVCPPGLIVYSISKIDLNPSYSDEDKIYISWPGGPGLDYKRKTILRNFSRKAESWKWLNLDDKTSDNKGQISDQGRFLSNIDIYKGETGGPSKLRWL